MPGGEKVELAPQGAGAGHLDVGVGVGLVVVAEDEQVVLVVLQGCRNGGQAHVHTAAVAAEGDDVDGLFLHLALAHQGGQAGRGAGGGGTAGTQLGVHPRHDPRRAVVSGVGHVHAAGAADDDGARTGGLDHEAHDQGGLAALTGAVAGGEAFEHRDLFDAPNLGQLLL